MEENILEKRQCARFPATFPVSITSEFLGESIDLSETGLRFNLDKPLPLLSKPRVKIRFSSQESIETEFKVIWNKNFLKENKVTYGVSFVKLGDADLSNLRNIIIESNPGYISKKAKPLNLSRIELCNDLKGIISEIAGVTISDIKNSTNLQKHLGIDSFSATEILVAVEQKYGVIIKKTDAFGVKTFKDVLNLAEKYLQENRLRR